MTEVDKTAIPDPEVIYRGSQKRYSLAFKLRILAEANELTGLGEVPAMLRREGLYASTLSDFRSQFAQGKLTGTPVQGPKATAPNDALSRHVAVLERENRKLRRDLARAAIVIDVQKKVSELLGITLEEAAENQEQK